MDFLHYQQGHLFANQIAIADLAKQYGTPLYVYSADHISKQFLAYEQELAANKHLVCYAVKANSNLAVLSLLAKLGSGFDIVSQGELERVLKAGADPKKIVFSGVAKSIVEIERALEVDIKCFNVESEPELYRIDEVAKRLGKIAPISLRINPDVDAKTHPYISTGLRENKFGISYQLALDIYEKARSLAHINIVGIDCHIGSQLTQLSPFLDAADRILALVDKLQSNGIFIKHIDFGGGLGVCYDNEQPPTALQLVTELKNKLVNYPDIEILFEPGRSIVANSGLLITKVEYTKHQDSNHFAIVDAGMNDLIRPALYEAWMNVLPEKQPQASDEPFIYNVVGPICESSDVLAYQRALSVKQNDLLVICSAGAYGFSMASNYNSHPRPAEVMLINEQQHKLIRQRESLDDLWRGEVVL
ncbi:diaminopimelate decarboxylase [Gilliamella sp. Fer1-1]|jgi:diaminopimelate decarboxylase|uniref:diaminopimelate decarboxylase n=1 Tax=unclassified Gilliamella TaxID=2685620 RepID=UPI00080E67E2|nr:diaminopimelate decarboxylase [Gilliamella apicola]OCG18244.1 diaminopimelate decarboxylase [Gilliamella apicola]OCG25216.1 diaminopimelate decarboxylase [Gilliamella apicola]OCG26899.1 diaminopimelate decarboxylase [Gilliamella apicola]OCG34632.1 diaminopimelate decarboxylase [Gilliamella apicola]OCG39628.1 diaminopimelate decarboxylase [Gilliamella apicola]